MDDDGEDYSRVSFAESFDNDDDDYLGHVAQPAGGSRSAPGSSPVRNLCRRVVFGLPACLLCLACRLACLPACLLACLLACGGRSLSFVIVFRDVAHASIHSLGCVAWPACVDTLTVCERLRRLGLRQ